MAGADYDHIVIGAGMSGMSAAHELAEHGRTLLLEREAAGAVHSTGRSAAVLFLTYGPPAVRALTRATLPLLRSPPRGFTATDLVRRRGALHVADRAHAARLDAFRRDPDQAAATREITVAEALSHVPILRADYVVKALFESNCWDLDVHAIHEGYRRGAIARGVVSLFHGEVQAIRREPSSWHVCTERGEFTGRVLVNAAGAWADEVARLAGVRALAIEPRRRTIVLVPVAGRDIGAWPMVIDAQESLYFKPEAGRLLVSPADATPSAAVDAQPEEWDVAVAIDRLQHATSLEVPRIEHAWAGLRSFAPDGVPVIGFDPGDERFFWLAGQGGYGIQIGAAAAQLCADLVARRPIRRDLLAAGVDHESMSPARRALGAGA